MLYYLSKNNISLRCVLTPTMYVASNKLSYCRINAKGYKHKKDKAIT